MLNSQVQLSRQLARLVINDGRTTLKSSPYRLCLASGSSVPQSKSIVNLCLPSKRNFSESVKRSAESIETLSSISIGSLRPLQPKKQRKRLGRGPGSGRGGTSTKGHKGQKSRAGNGKPTPGFEGGQTPIMRRFPKRGFTNAFAKEYVPLSLGRIQTWIDQGRLDPEQPITARELLESSCIHSYGDGIKIFAGSDTGLRTPIHLVVSRASTPAIKVIESLGGSIICKYYTRTSLEALVKPHKFIDRLPARDPMPVGKKDLLYYASKARRGYLADRTPEPRRSKVTERPISNSSNNVQEIQDI